MAVRMVRVDTSVVVVAVVALALEYETLQIFQPNNH